VDRIEKLITSRTKLIFISHITCTTGQIFPLQEIGELAKAKGIWFAVDGAQAVGTMPMDIKNAHVNFYAFSGHKWTLGPKRTGVLYVQNDLLDVLRPVTVGAYSDDGFNILKNELKLHPTAQRYEYATQNDALFYGYEKGAEFVKTIGLEKVRKHNRALAEKFYAGLQEIPRAEILSPEEEKYRSSIISFKIKDKSFQDVGSYLTEKKRIRVRGVSEANVNGTRVSFHVYNSGQDVEKILTELKNFLKE
jgi:selenocysteine lyase/cysteine desulfurase